MSGKRGSVASGKAGAASVVDLASHSTGAASSRGLVLRRNKRRRVSRQADRLAGRAASWASSNTRHRSSSGGSNTEATSQRREEAHLRARVAGQARRAGVPLDAYVRQRLGALAGRRGGDARWERGVLEGILAGREVFGSANMLHEVARHLNARNLDRVRLASKSMAHVPTAWLRRRDAWRPPFVRSGPWRLDLDAEPITIPLVLDNPTRTRVQEWLRQLARRRAYHTVDAAAYVALLARVRTSLERIRDDAKNAVLDDMVRVETEARQRAWNNELKVGTVLRVIDRRRTLYGMYIAAFLLFSLPFRRMTVARMTAGDPWWTREPEPYVYIRE